jgi:hypothetical protein
MKLPLGDNIYEIGKLYFWQNKVLFCDEIIYNYDINNKTVDLRLVEKDTYLNEISSIF